MTIELACMWFVVGIVAALFVYCVYVVLFTPNEHGEGDGRG